MPVNFYAAHTWGVTHATKRAADDLFAEQLRAESAHTENVCDRVRVPAFGEHRDGNDAFDLFAELARFADSVHYLAKQIFVRESSTSRPGNRIRYSVLNSSISSDGDFLEFGAHCLAGFELLLSTKMVFGRCSPATMSTLLKSGSLPAQARRFCLGNFPSPILRCIEDEIRDVGVIAYDDEDRRRQTPVSRFSVLLPAAVILFVIAVETLQSALAIQREALARPFPSHPSRVPSSAGFHGCEARDPDMSAARRASRHLQRERGEPSQCRTRSRR